MPRVVNIPADAPPQEAPTVESLTRAVSDAREAFDELLAERREKRATLSKDAFRAYNEETADIQVRLQTELADAEKRLSRFLGRTGRKVKVETASEKSKAGD